jgi:hypothetical protein
MRGLSSNSHRIPTNRRIMGDMGIAGKVAVGLVLLLPMTGYVVRSLVAAAEPPREHAPIIVQEQTDSPKPSKSPSDKPKKGDKDDREDDHKGQGKGDDRSDEGDDDPPEIIQPSPSDLFDDDFDDDGDDDNSGKGSSGSDDDSSGKGSGHD